MGIARPGAAARAAAGLPGGRAMLLLGEHELAALDGQHLEGVHAEAVVVLGREVEDAGGADEALEALEGRAGLLLVGAADLDRLDEQRERVVGVAAEGARRLLGQLPRSPSCT